jgi:hypothetical protein
MVNMGMGITTSDFMQLGPTVQRKQRSGKRETSRRRRAVTYQVQARQLASAAGGNPIDRHKPYQYGRSSQRMRDNIAKAYAASLEREAAD